jgi:cytochrome c oxidase assembly protein subunit 15
MAKDSIDVLPGLRSHRYLLLTATLLTYLLITLGGVVCVTESGRACPDWPLCYGQPIPPARIDAIIEYTHRFVALLTTPFIFAAAILGWRKFRSLQWVSRPPAISIIFLLAVVVFGAFAVLTGLAPGVAVLDLGSALMVLVLMVTASVAAFLYYRQPDLPNRMSFDSSFGRLSLAGLAANFVVLVSAVLVAKPGTVTRCLGWPLFSGGVFPLSLAGWPQMLRAGVALLATLLVFALLIQAWRTARRNSAILFSAAAATVLLLVEAAAGAWMATRGLSAGWLIIYVAAAGGQFAMLVILSVLAGLTVPQPSPLQARKSQVSAPA